MINLLFWFLLGDYIQLIKLDEMSKVRLVSKQHWLFLQAFHWPAFRNKLMQIWLCWSLAHCVTTLGSCRSVSAQVKNEIITLSLLYLFSETQFIQHSTHCAHKAFISDGDKKKKKIPSTVIIITFLTGSTKVRSFVYLAQTFKSQELWGREREQLFTLTFKCQPLMKLITQAPVPSYASTSPQSFFSLSLSFTNTSILDPQSCVFTTDRKSFKAQEKDNLFLRIRKKTKNIQFHRQERIMSNFRSKPLTLQYIVNALWGTDAV